MTDNQATWITVPIGMNLDMACMLLAREAGNGRTISTEFNGVTITAKPGDTVAALREQWEASLARGKADDAARVQSDEDLFATLKAAFAELVQLANEEGVRVSTLRLWAAHKMPGGPTITVGPETPKTCAALADAMERAKL